ncbi:peptide/nickel transport system substrate-binding protein [Actinoplanes octamycinicus]|uniref:Peptide/nickel transport system substrate-binding protein n=1 Tax=Actinoplanes octamycinicus TaxID=135948 RepID=A0A7W7MCB3_9ACTN|nr:ABC transporter substrate-binding protein [Actinoplanes octamycinicus]MBB4744916.1 peptide/nickel transport system substrate-binding protein [Actinoplanes octamycinicus]GIE55501.1 ABC transporter substrate-binding protein [Actinoplanes octamycinicus]
MRKLVPAVLSVTVLLAGCQGGGGDGSTTTSTAAFDPATCQGGTLTVLNQGGINHLDPARLYTSGGGNLPSLLFRTLTTRNRQPGEAGAKAAPDLATDLGTPSDGAKIWTYHLRDDIFFEDGTPITAKDVKYGIERSFAPELPGGAPYLRDWLDGAADYQGPYKQPDGIKSIETPDDKTIIFKLRKPEGDFPFLATATQFAPVPKAKDSGVDYEKHPISSGPYQVESYEPKKSLVLVRNKHWSTKIDELRYACPDRIEVTSGLDAAVINQRLVTGAGQDANAVTTDAVVGPEQLAQLGTGSELDKRVTRGEFPSTLYLAFNTKKAPFDNPKVREALSYAINRTSVVNALGGSAVQGASTTFLPPQKALGQQPYDYFPAGASGDPAKAKQVLAEAGLTDLTVEVTHENDDSEGIGPKVAAAVQEAFKQAGVTVKLNAIDAATYRDVIGKPATQPGLVLTTWGADWPSGGPFLIPIFDGRQIITAGGNFNLAQYNDPAVNAEIDAINALTDPAAAAARWGALDAKIGKLALVIPLTYEKDVYLYGKNVKNAYADGWRGQLDIARISVK